MSHISSQASATLAQGSDTGYPGYPALHSSSTGLPGYPALHTIMSCHASKWHAGDDCRLTIMQAAGLDARKPHKSSSYSSSHAVISNVSSGVAYEAPGLLSRCQQLHTAKLSRCDNRHPLGNNGAKHLLPLHPQGMTVISHQHHMQ